VSQELTAGEVATSPSLIGVPSKANSAMSLARASFVIVIW